jgi:hypothetical protein
MFRSVDLYNKGIKELENGILLSFERSMGVPEMKEHIQARKLQHKVSFFSIATSNNSEI